MKSNQFCLLIVALLLSFLGYIKAQTNHVAIRAEDYRWIQDANLISPEWRVDLYAQIYINDELIDESEYGDYYFKWYQDDAHPGIFQLEQEGYG